VRTRPPQRGPEVDAAVERALAAGRVALARTAEALAAAAHRLDDAADVVNLLLAASGRVAVTGLGKSGLVGAKLAATLSSMGTPAYFVHAADALHGDAGLVQPGDALLAISKSGSTPEVLEFARIVRDRETSVVAVTGCGGTSPLCRLADACLDISVGCEADPFDLAPTASTVVTAAIGDALAVALMVARGFGPAEFHRNHPGGALGDRLRTVGAPR
jgi:arabinose-5-phosphate isomerase